MISPIQTKAIDAGSDEARLRKACRQMEAVFMTELLKNMRATVEKQDVADGGSAEETFSSMLDEHIASLSSTNKGIADALYAQLRGRLEATP